MRSIIPLVFLMVCIPLPVNATSSTKEKHSLEEQWKRLLALPCCLVGKQYCVVRKGKSHCAIDLPLNHSEEQCFTTPPWRRFLLSDPHRVSKFLLGRIGRKNPTKIHVCPFNDAIEGELAVYGLQQILRVNWYDLASNYRKLSNEAKSTQSALQKLIRSKSAARTLIGRFSQKNRKR